MPSSQAAGCDALPDHDPQAGELARWPTKRFCFCPHLVQFGANHASDQGRYREVLLKGMEPKTAIERARKGHAQPGRRFTGMGLELNQVLIGNRRRGWVRGLRGVGGSRVLTVGQSRKTQGHGTAPSLSRNLAPMLQYDAILRSFESALPSVRSSPVEAASDRNEKSQPH